MNWLVTILAINEQKQSTCILTLKMMQEEAAKYQSFNEILSKISAKKAEVRKETGQKTPGRKPVKKSSQEGCFQA